MSSRAIDLAAALAILAGAVWFWALAGEMPVSRRYAAVDTSFWPRIVYATLALVALGIVVRAALDLRAAGMAARPAAAPESVEAPSGVWRIVAIGALVAIYFLAFRTTGFLLATTVFLWAASFLLSRDHALAKVLFAPLFTLGLTLVFSRALGLPLPRGTGAFHDLNLMLY